MSNNFPVQSSGGCEMKSSKCFEMERSSTGHSVIVILDDDEEEDNDVQPSNCKSKSDDYLIFWCCIIQLYLIMRPFIYF